MTPQNKTTSAVTDAVDDQAAKEKSSQVASAAGNTTLSTLKGVEAGRKAVTGAAGTVASAATSAAGTVASAATTTWVLVNARKAVAAGVGAGVVALSAASFAVGRATGRPAQGPLTRLTGGRL